MYNNKIEITAALCGLEVYLGYKNEAELRCMGRDEGQRGERTASNCQRMSGKWCFMATHKDALEMSLLYIYGVGERERERERGRTHPIWEKVLPWNRVDRSH